MQKMNLETQKILPLKIKKLHPAAMLPTYATPGAACFDLYALPEKDSAVSVMAGLPATIPTGLAFEVPEGHVMLIFSRSGHGFNNDTRLANCVGVIDSDYRGEVKVKLTRDQSPTSYTIFKHGDRIAQAMVIPLPKVAFEVVEELSDTQRGNGGFGSTGA